MNITPEQRERRIDLIGKKYKGGGLSEVEERELSSLRELFRVSNLASLRCIAPIKGRR